MNTNIIFYSVIALIVGYLLYNQFFANLGVSQVDTDEFEILLNDDQYYVVDVRETHEYNEGHIDGVPNVPLSTLNGNMDQIPKNQTAVIICRSGNRSMQAIRKLEAEGYENLINVKGGMLAWNGDVVR